MSTPDFKSLLQTEFRKLPVTLYTSSPTRIHALENLTKEDIPLLVAAMSNSQRKEIHNELQSSFKDFNEKWKLLVDLGAPSKELMLSTYLLRGFTWESHEYFLHWILNMVQAMPQHDFKVIDVVRWFHGSFEARPPYAPKPAWSIRDLNRLSLLLENKPLQWNDPIVAIQRLYISNGPREPKILGSIYRDVYEFFPPETHLALAASGAAPENINHQDVIYIFNAMNGLPTSPCSNPLVLAGVDLKISPEQWLIYHQTPIEEPVSDVVGIF